MSDEYIKLAKAPQFVIQYPTCSACCIDLGYDGDGFVCPSCGTSWASDASDGDRGELYAEWAGEESEGPVATEDEAANWGYYLEAKHRHERFGSIMPNLCPEPNRPTFASEADQ